MTISEIREETKELINAIIRNHIDPEISSIWSMVYGGTYHIRQKAFAFDGYTIQLTGSKDFLSLREVHHIYMGINGCRWCNISFDGNFIFIDSYWDDQMVMFYKDSESWWGCTNRFIVDKYAPIFYRGEFYRAGDKIPGLDGPNMVSTTQVEYLK